MTPVLEIAASFLKIEAMRYGGPAIMGIMPLTPGPISMLAAFVGDKVGGVAGVAVAAAAICLPSFVLILSVIPALNRARRATWVKAFMRGVGPAVIGAIAASLVAILPHVAPDPAAIAILVATVIGSLRWRVGPLPLMVAGGAVGIARRALRVGAAFLVR